MSGKFWIDGWVGGLRQIRMDMAKQVTKEEADKLVARTEQDGGVDVDVRPWRGTWQIGYTIMAKMSLDEGGLEFRTRPGGGHYLKPTKDNPLQKALRAKGL